MNPKLKKIIFYPIGQIFSMSFIFYYRYRDYFTKEGISGIRVAGICSVINAISSILYTLIFIMSNNIFFSNNNETIRDEKLTIFDLKEDWKSTE